MKRTHYSSITVGMALVAGDCAFAEDSDIQTKLAMIRNIKFITENSSLQYDGQALPSVTVVTEGELQTLFLAAAVHDYSIRLGVSRLITTATQTRFC